MKLAISQGPDDLHSMIRTRFIEFNKGGVPARGCKYPKELKDLVREAAASGTDLSTLCQLTGVSAKTMVRWIKVVKPQTPRRASKPPIASRRLEVVATTHSSITVRLLSGVTIEFGDAAALTGDLLKALAALEAGRAASC